MISRFPQEIESGGVLLTLTPDEVYIEFKKEQSPEEIEEFIKGYELRLVEEEKLGVLPTPGFNEVFPNRLWLRLPREAHIDEFINRLLKNERVRLASPVYHRADLLPKKTGITFSDFLLVKFQPQVSDEDIEAFIDHSHTSDVSSPSLLVDGLHRLRIKRPKGRYALKVAEKFAESPLVKYVEPDWAQLHSAISRTPLETYWENQWNMTRIAAPEGWDLSRGSNDVVIAILDTGCDLNHEDLSAKYVPEADRWDACDGTNTPEDDHGHGTCCAGIAAAHTNNNQGVAGVAWNCRIMPIKVERVDTADIHESWMVSGINWARTHGAHVISMSNQTDGPHANIETAINNAHEDNIVLVAASGNQDCAIINYPASHQFVIAVGASDQSDQRWVSRYLGSQFGPELDVMAPGVNIWTTDRSGLTVGYNPDRYTGDIRGDADGNYFNNFCGTSAATPHVAGLAALLRSLYPTLTNDEIRSIIEKTAEKVGEDEGEYDYAYDPAHPSGTWNNEMGYGRINVFRALDFADVYIKDNPADDGRVPSVGNFYGNSDIFVRQIDDGILEHDKAIKKDQTNYIYVRVTNLGPAIARNVQVRVHAVRYPGTEFVYPDDWPAEDETHTEDETYIQPTGIVTHFRNLTPGEPTYAKFSLSAEQIDRLYDWETGGCHLCLLAVVQCDNDHGTPWGVHTWLDNNLAQLNLDEIETSAESPRPPYPFLVGNKLNRELYMELVIDRYRLPREVEVLLDPWDTKTYFPALELPKARKAITFLDRTRLEVSLCGCDGILTVEAGSSFECGASAEEVSLQGAELVMREGKRLIAIREDQAVIGLHKRPGEMRQMSLSFRVPDEAELGGRYQIDISQRNTKQEIVGGITLVVKVTE